MGKDKDKPRLGRGLASLLGAAAEPPMPTPAPPASKTAMPDPAGPAVLPAESVPAHPHGGTLTRLIPVGRIGPNPFQPRLQSDPQALAELVESIRQHGIVQPLVVRPRNDHYELMAGQRRLEAARQLALAAVPAVVRDATDQQMLEVALVENIHREDLNCVDRATAYKNYQDTFQLSPEAIAERLGQDRSTVINYLRLLALADPVLDLLRSARISMGHARALAGLEIPEQQTKLAFRIAQLGLSVRQTEQNVAKMKSGTPTVAREPQKNPNVLDLEQQMMRSLSTKVQIVPARKKGTGRVVIEFFSLDDFDRIIDRICGPDREDL